MGDVILTSISLSKGDTNIYQTSGYYNHWLYPISISSTSFERQNVVCEIWKNIKTTYGIGIYSNHTYFSFMIITKEVFYGTQYRYLYDRLKTDSYVIEKDLYIRI
jgi:hypothetical protein